MPYIVVNEDGEIVEELCGRRIVALNDGDRVVRKRSRDFLKKKSSGRKGEYIYKDDTVRALGDSFTKTNIEEMRLMLGALDVYEKAFLFGITPYTGYVDCKIKNDNGRPLDVKDFAELSGMSLSKTYEVVNRLIDKCIICKENNEYFVNPWLVSRGTRIDLRIKKMFGDYQVRCENMTPWKEL